jgi:hypothetical protein
MVSSDLDIKDELIREIKEKIQVISGESEGIPVYLENVAFPETDRSAGGGKITITCLFINEDGRLRADMHRSGCAGCVDFICGISLNLLDERSLGKIVYALNENRWSMPEIPAGKKQKKRNPVSVFKLPFLQKGA